MATAIKKLTNANLYLDGVSYLGKVEEITLPDVQLTQTEYNALGMNAKLDLPSGMDKMELAIKWTSILGDVYKKVANGFDALDLQVRSSLETFESGGRTAEDSFVVYFKGMPKNIPGGAFKQHDALEAETKFSVNYIKLEIAGAVIYEIDVINNIYVVDGSDKLATFRANLGI